MSGNLSKESDEWARLLHRLLNRAVPSFPEDEQLDAQNATQTAPPPVAATTSTTDCKDRGISFTCNEILFEELESSLASINSLSPDTTAIMLSHLQPHDLFNFSITSKRGNKAFHNELLWKHKFVDRWNCPDLESQAEDDTENASGFWRQAYMSAYKNTHDLWIRHWNCVYPEDVTTSHGRTVVPALKFNSCSRVNEVNQDILDRSFCSDSLKLCPTCRYHPMLQNETGYNSDILQAVKDELGYAQELEQSALTSDDDDPVQTAEEVAAAHAILEQSSAARAIYYSTMYSIAKWCRNVRMADSGGSSAESLLHKFDQELCNKRESQQKIQQNAIRAFEHASTYNRCINTNQYRSSGLHFLTDALFFNIHPSHENGRSSSMLGSSRLGCSESLNDNRTHLDELLKDLNQENAHQSSPHSVSELGPRYETAHHSWHVIKLTNPDYVRPITFRAYIQCPKAFTLFPSQGFLKGGQSMYLVLGVRAFGSLLNEAFESVNVEREEAPPSYQTLNKNKGHLPFVPFVIRYMFAPCLPCVPHDYEPRFDNQTRNPFAPTNPQPSPTKFQSAVHHLWDNVTVEADVRTIPISCHVNSNYSLHEFQNATLMPFYVKSSISNQLDTPLTAVMPQVMERNNSLFNMIQNLHLEIRESHAAYTYRTEKCCCNCKRDWGAQSEALGRAYILRRLGIEWNALIQYKERTCFKKTLKTMPSMLRKVLLDDGDSPIKQTQASIPQLNQILQLIYLMQVDYLRPMKANRLILEGDRGLLSLCEKYLDNVYSDIQECTHAIESEASKQMNENQMQRWRKRGIYKNSRCTDLVISDSRVDDTDNIFKAEPYHLRQFRSLEHSSGFNFGKQDDPNHEESVSSKGSDTDMFHNNALKGLMSALAMIGKPESLLGHGIYDRVEDTGNLIRCPSYPSYAFFRPTGKRSHNELMERALKLVGKWAVAIHFSTKNKRGYWKDVNLELNEQDPDGLNIMTLGMEDFTVNFHTTMAHFISNVPLPGQGRLLFSSPRGDHERVTDIVSLYSCVQPYSQIIFRSTDSCDKQDCTSATTSNEQNTNRNQRPRPNDGADQMIELNIVWLIARHLGWTVDDDRSRGAILVDRRILIAVQWFSNTIMTFSLLGSLLSRKLKLIKHIPADFHFFGGQLKISYNDMRFWTAEECGFAALIVFGFFIVLGRLSERNVSRTFEREMRDFVPEQPPHRFAAMWRLTESAQRLYDKICPWMLQQIFFVPRSNRRSRQQILDSISYLRSIDYREHRSSFDAIVGRGRAQIKDRKLGFWSHAMGLSFALFSFAACSPHFVVNSLTVFCCALAFGMSMSVESLENLRRTTSTGVLSMVKPRRLNTLVIGHILIGQLVGGSGGITFLAEFVVTSICLILGGAATITSRAVESWITFVCLASTAFWGFVFARLGLLDAVRKRRRAIPSALLCASLCSAFMMWVGVFTRVDWQALTPGDLILIQVHRLLTDLRERWSGT